MKKALVTIACGPFFEQMATLTHPTLEAYARKIGADFIVWRDAAGHTLPHYRKLELGKLLDEYDRVLYLDTDILVRDDAPDLFEIVPEGELGMLEEGRHFKRTIDVIQYMQAVGYDARGWDGNYYNTGVMVLSKAHQNLFAQPAVEIDHLKEQTHLNLMIAHTKTKVFQLPHRLNRMYYMDWLYGEDPCDCYLLHYAGRQAFTSEAELLETVVRDKATWQRSKPRYRFARHVALVVQGGLGDQVVAEPALRFAREVLYPNDKLVIVSSFPELFGHLELPVHAELAQIPDSARYQRRFTGVNTSHLETRCTDRRQVHGVDLASLNLLGVELLQAFKQPKLSVDPAAAASLKSKIGRYDCRQLVVLQVNHASGGVAFPTEVWQSYINSLVGQGYPLAIVADDMSLAAEVPPLDTLRAIDLLGKLTTAELVALLSEAPVVISGDTSAVQVAGAFDGWIGLIATARHPEYVLPWRNGSLFHKAKSLERTALYERAELVPGLEPASIVECSEQRVRASLPEAAAVLKFVREALS